MKAYLNERQKKWALTTTLMAVLGFNLSAPLQSSLSSMDLASKSSKCEEQKTRKIKLEVSSKKGSKKVTDEYDAQIICKDDQAVALVPYEVEGGTCSKGGCLSEIPLDTEFTANISKIGEALNIELDKRRDLPSKSKPENPGGSIIRRDKPDEDQEETDLSAKERRERAEENKKDRKLEADKKALARVKSYCKSEEAGEEMAQCLKKGLLDLLRERKGDKAIDRKLALEFFNEEIKSELKEAIKTPDAYTHDRLGSLISDLLARLPKGYNEIRTEANRLNSDMMRLFAAKVASTKQQAESYKRQADQLAQDARNNSNNPSYAMELQQKSMYAQQLAMQLDNQYKTQQDSLRRVLFPTLYQHTLGGLTDAYNDKLIDQGFGQSLLSSFVTDARTIDTSITMPLNNGIFGLPDGTVIGNAGRVSVPNVIVNGPGGSFTRSQGQQQSPQFGPGNSPINPGYAPQRQIIQQQPFQRRY